MTKRARTLILALGGDEPADNANVYHAALRTAAQLRAGEHFVLDVAGASQAIMDEFAKGPGTSVIEDLSKVAVFSVGMIGPEGAAVADSSTGKGVFRGTIRFGGDLIGRTMEYAGKILGGGEYPKVIWDALDMVTAKDGKLYAVPVESAKVLTVPTTEPQELMLPPGPP